MNKINAISIVPTNEPGETIPKPAPTMIEIIAGMFIFMLVWKIYVDAKT